MNNLNLGCRNNYRVGWVNAEIDQSCRADVYFDMTKFPYPFNDNTFDKILAHAILEHIPNPSKVLKELHRISKPNARIYILVPHASDPLRHCDLTHINFFNSRTFKCGFNTDLYPLFEELKCKISFTRVNHTWLNKIFNPLINFSQVFYERFLTGFIQSSCIVFILKVNKNADFICSRKVKMQIQELSYGKKWSDGLDFIRTI